MDSKLYEKLNEIKDLEDRALLKKIMNSVFNSLEQYTEDSFNHLEQRVFSELEYVKEKYNIYGAIVKRENIDLTDDFLYPILSEDVEEQIYDTKEIIEILENKEAKKMFKIFLKCDYSIFKEFIYGNYQIKGIIETDKKVHEANFKVFENKEYTDKVSKLYKSFINSNIRWTTINNPYIHKIADVVLAGCNDKIEEDENIVKIEVDFGRYNQYIKYDMVPLWNIKELSLKCSGFPTPCIDKINYEHNISIVKEGERNGYLVDYENQDINYIMLTNKAVIISSKIDEAVPWKLWNIINYDKCKVYQYEYELMTNGVNVNFSNKLAFEKPYTVKTKTELARVINSYKASEYFKFNNVKLEEIHKEEINDSYEVNNFIIDEIRDEKVKRVLTLYFEPIDKENYLNKDILSFLVSEVQLIYPEYKCEGRLI